MLFGAVTDLLPAALNSQLVRDHDVTLFDYLVLLELSRAPDATLRPKALAACTSATLPRVSRVATRLEAEGLVTRSGGARGDGRAINVTLTAAGRDLLERATPGHHETLRALLLDALTSEQLGQLKEISLALLERLHPDAELPVDRQQARAMPE